MNVEPFGKFKIKLRIKIGYVFLRYQKKSKVCFYIVRCQLAARHLEFASLTCAPSQQRRLSKTHPNTFRILNVGAWSCWISAMESAEICESGSLGGNGASFKGRQPVCLGLPRDVACNSLLTRKRAKTRAGFLTTRIKNGII